MTKFFISPGDPAGIGPEVTLKALTKNKEIQNNFILAGDKNLYQNLISQNNLDLNLIEEDSDEEGVIFKHFPLKNNVSIGNPDVGNALPTSGLPIETLFFKGKCLKITPSSSESSSIKLRSRLFWLIRF